MTEDQKETFLQIARCGVTCGFQHPLEWIANYCRGFVSVLPYESQEKAAQEAYETYAAFYSEAGPGAPTTVREVEDMVIAFYKRCSFPGCYTEGEGKVPNLENTNLQLCEEHEGCMRGPE